MLVGLRQSTVEVCVRGLARAAAAPLRAIVVALVVLWLSLLATPALANSCDDFDFDTNNPVLRVPENLPIAAYQPMAQITPDAGFLQGCARQAKFSISGNLPAGVSFDTATGTISGTPTATPAGATATYVFEITATNPNAGYPDTITYPFSIIVYHNIALQQNSSALVDPRTGIITPNTLTLRAGQPVSARPLDAIDGFGTGRAWTISPGLPAGLTFDTASGTISGTPALSTANLPGASYTIAVSDLVSFGSTPISTASQAITLAIEPGLVTTLGPLPARIVSGVAVTPFRPVMATGGVGAITYALSGALPAGLTFDTSTGEISGTPTEVGYNIGFVVTATDSHGVSARQSFDLVFGGIQPKVLEPTVSMVSKFGYIEQPVQFSGAVGTQTVTVSPTLPNGLALDPATGRISGTPVVRIAPTVFTLTATDTGTPQARSSAQFTLDVAPQPAITTAITPAGGANSGGTNVTITGSNLGPDYGDTTISIAGYTMQNVTYAANGTSASFVLPAMPGVSGTFGVDVRNGSDPATFAQNLSFTLTKALSVTEPPNDVVRLIGAGPFTVRPVIGIDGVGTLSYAESGLMPPGFSFDTATGTITGTPTGKGGVTGISITVTDQDNPPASVIKTINLEITPPVQTTLAAGNFNLSTGQAAFLTPVTASGGTDPLVFSATGLPGGLSIDPATGAITGTPSYGAGTPQSVTVTVAPTPGYPASVSSKTFTITVTGVHAAYQNQTQLSYDLGDQLRFGGTVQTNYAPFLATGGTGAISYSVSPALPAGLSLNSSTGVISGTAQTVSPLTTYTVTATDSASPPTRISSTFPLEVKAIAPTITGVSGALSDRGGDTVTVTGSLFGPPFATTTTVTLGGQPVTNLAFGAGGTSLSFTTPVLPAGNASLVITNDGTRSASRTLSISAFPTLTLRANQPLVEMTQGAAGLAQPVLVASGGQNGRSFAIAPALPAGLAFSTTNGAISGVPSGLTDHQTYTVTVTDGSTPPQVASQSFVLNVTAPPAVVPPPVITSLSATEASSAGGTRITVTGSGFRSDTVFGFGGFSADRRATQVAVSPDGTHADLVVPPKGSFTGQPTLYATTASAGSAVASASFYYAAPPASNAGIAPPVWFLGEAITPVVPQNVYSRGIGTLTYSVSPALPAGLALDPATGVVSGTPTALIGNGAPSTASYTFTATDSSATPEATSITLALTVARRLEATVAVPVLTLDPGVAMVPTRPVVRNGGVDLTVGGSITPGGFIELPPLPAGLSWDASTGEITGTPTQTFGPTSVDVVITDTGAAGVAGSQLTRSFTLQVRPVLSAAHQSDVAVALGAPLDATPVKAQGGVGALHFSLDKPLPYGLTMDPATGHITGTPSAPVASTAYTVTLTDSAPVPASASAGFNLAITAPAPAITSLSRSHGASGGGDTLIIRGTGFVQYPALPGAFQVEFVGAGGTVAAVSPTIVNDSQILVTTPAATAGAYAVRVTLPQGQSADTPADAFTYELIGPASVALSTSTVQASAPFSIDATFFEAVTGFNASKVQLGGSGGTGGTVTVTGSGKSYQLLVTPAADGLVTVQIPAGAVTGTVSGVANLASNTISVPFRATPVSVTVTLGQKNGYNPVEPIALTNHPITAYFQFTDAVTGFGLASLTTDGGTTLSNFQQISPSFYSVDVDHASDGVATVTLPAGKVQDANGITLQVSGSGSSTFDRTPPTYTISAPPQNSFAKGQVQVVVTFSEPLKVGNGSTIPGASPQFWRHIGPGGALSYPTGSSQLSDRSYLVTYNVTQQGVGTINLQPSIYFFDGTPASGSYTLMDAAGNAVVKANYPTQTVTDPYSAPGGFSPTTRTSSDVVLMVDGIAPWVDVSQEGGSASVTGKFDVRVKFTGDPTYASIYGPPGPDGVTGFSLSGVSVTNGTASNLRCPVDAPGGAEYGPASAECLITITPAAAGTTTVAVSPSAAFDRGGNGNRASNTLSVTVSASLQTSPPVLTITRPLASSNAPEVVTFAFSKDVTGFDASKITAGDGTLVSNFQTVDAHTYTASVTRASDGTASVSVAAGAAQDSLGQPSSAAATSFTMDVTRPTLSIELPGTGSVPNAPFDVTFRFSEAVTGFALGSITATNATASNLRGASGDSAYIATITPSGSGAVSLGIPAAVVFDLSGNGNRAASAQTYALDATAPVATLALQDPAAQITTQPFVLKASFSKPVVDLTLSDFAVSNGAASNLSCDSADPNLPPAVQNCTVTITPVTTGALTVDLAAGAVTDRPGTKSGPVHFAVTVVPPAPVPALAGPSGPQKGAFAVTVTFGSPVTGLQASGFAVTNGTASGLTGSGASYTITITPAADGNVVIAVPAGAATGGNGLASLAATPLTVLADLTAPVATLAGPTTPQRAAFTVTLTLSEPVTGLTASSLTATNATLSGFTGSGTSYQVLVTPAADGDVVVSLGAGAVSDPAGNPNKAVSLTVKYDTTPPQVAITSTATAPRGPFTATITFTEPVTGFDVSKIAATNATLSAFTGAGAVYTVTVTPGPTRPIPVSLAIAAGAASDLAGNASLVAPSYQVTAIKQGTAATIAGPTATQTKPFVLDLSFDSTVTGLTAAKFMLTNASAGALTGSGAAYQLTVSPLADGPVTVMLPDGAATNSDGFGTIASPLYTVQADVTPPKAAFTGPAGIQRGAFDLTITFTEPVTGFDASRLTLTGATASNFAGSGAVYTVHLTPTADGTISVGLAAGAASDLAGNPSVATAYSTTVDTTPPTGAITAPAGTQFAAFTATITFSEPVTGFDISKIAVTNATLGGFSGSGASYTVVVTPVDTGPVDVTLGIAAGAFSDIAGNPGVMVPTLHVAADLSQPVIQTATPNLTVNLSVSSSVVDLSSIKGTIDLHNASGVSASFTAASDAPWLDVAPQSGTIVGQANVQLTVSLNSQVNSLKPGQYTGHVLLSFQKAASASAAGTGSGVRALGGTQLVQQLQVPVQITVAARQGTLVIVAVAAQAGIAGNATFGYSSTEPALNGLSLTTSGGQASSQSFQFTVGRYPISEVLPLGWALQSIACTGDTAQGSTFDVAKRSAVIAVNGGENLVCTFTNVRDAGYVQLQTRRAIVAFLSERARLLEANGPDLMGRADDTPIGKRGELGSVTATGNGGNVNLDMRYKMALSGSHDGTDGGGKAVETNTGVVLWAQANLATTRLQDARTHTDAVTNFLVGYLGVDVPVSDGFRVGVIGQFDRTDFHGRAGTADASGSGWLAGPYVAGRLGTLKLVGRVEWGASHDWVNPLGTWLDHFDTHRMLGEVRVANDFTLWQGIDADLKLRPEASLFYYRDSQLAYIDPLGIAIDGNKVDYGQFSFGPELISTRTLRTGARLQMSIRVAGQSVFNQLELVDPSGRLVSPYPTLTARVEGGIGLLLPGGLGIRLTGNYSGLGSNGSPTYGGSIRVTRGF